MSSFTRDLRAIAWPSEFIRQEYRRRLTSLPEIERVIPNAPPAEVLDVPPQLPQQLSGIRAVVLGQLSPHKGTGVVLEAASQLRIEGWSGTIEFAGRGPLSKEVEQAAATPGSRVRALGWLSRPSVRDLLLKADVLLMPSIWQENGPIVIQEAAALGATIVASKVGGIPEALSALPETKGTLVPPGDPRSLIAALVRVKPKSEIDIREGQIWGKKRRGELVAGYVRLYQDVLGAKR